MNQDVLETIKKVHEIFINERFTLSLAESCTGGLISHYITNLAGASDFYNAGIVSYSEEAKRSVIGVSPETISDHGAVSEETAREMAEKVRLRTKTDYSVSTTGNLGPDVLEGKEKGQIYLAASRDGKTVSRELRLKGNREENKKKAALSALRLLIELLEDG